MNLSLRLLRRFGLTALSIPVLALLGPSAHASDQPGQANLQPAVACETDALQAFAGPDTTVAIAFTGFDHCRVYGFVTTRDPGPNKVTFELLLPNRSAGRYLFIGVGAAGGVLPIVPRHLLAKGYAIASSDNGSGAQNLGDFRFMSDPAKSLDFAHRGLHVSARATQQIMKGYYKAASIYRYYTGCSGGGAAALTNAYVYGGADFDGFVPGAAPWWSNGIMANMGRIAQYFQTHPDGWMSPELLVRAEAAIVEAYDDTDGAKDGIIHDPEFKGFDVNVLRKVGFTEAQIEAFDFIRTPWRYVGPVAPADGMLPGHSINNVSAWPGFHTGHVAPPWKSTADTPLTDGALTGAPIVHYMFDSMLRARVDPNRYYVTQFDFSNPDDLTLYATQVRGNKLPVTPAPFSFDKVRKDGARFIWYHGAGDQNNSVLEFLKGVRLLRASDPTLNDWARFYVVPGMNHCRGGPGPQDVPDRALDAIASWVEDGIAPISIVANSVSTDPTASRSFLLCPWPQQAHLRSGQKDFRKAENWTCRTPDDENR